MEFISEKQHSNAFEELLYAVQQLYPFLLSIAKQYTVEVERVIPGISMAVPPGGSAIHISHAFTRCFTTRHILSEIFGMERWYTFSRLDLDNVTFRVISIGGGGGFPDHTFVTIKYNGVMYILQSYYHGYTLSGKYGVIKLDDTEAQDLDRILEKYKQLAASTARMITPLMAHVIANTNVELSRFTGVDPLRHIGNASAKFGPNEITITETYANALSVFNHVQYKINGFKKIMINNLADVTQTLRIDIAYQFADAFLKTSHPLLGHVNGEMVKLGKEHINDVFTEMTGIGLAGRIHGVFMGPIMSPTGQVIFPANAIIHMTLGATMTVFASINHILDQLILTANVKNARDLRHYHDELADILTAPIDKQTEKLAKVNGLIGRGVLHKLTII